MHIKLPTGAYTQSGIYGETHNHMLSGPRPLQRRNSETHHHILSGQRPLQLYINMYDEAPSCCQPLLS